jgi:hypothetical protein
MARTREAMLEWCIEADERTRAEPVKVLYWWQTSTAPVIVLNGRGDTQHAE